MTAGRAFTTYRQHYCERRHRGYAAMARCLWPRADLLTGDGPWATLATCRPRTLTVELHGTREAAEKALNAIRGHGCGGACLLGRAEPARRHRLIRLVLPGEQVRP